MFCSPQLAACIDRAEGRMCAAASEAGARNLSGPAGLRLPVGGGLAVYAGADSPLNKLTGLGFDGPVAAGELTRAEAEFAARGARLQAEVSTLADTELHGTLSARGYAPSGFENVLGHPLTANAIARSEWLDITVSAVRPPPGVTAGRPFARQRGVRFFAAAFFFFFAMVVSLAAVLGGSRAAASNARLSQRRSAAASCITISGSITFSLRTRPSPMGSNEAAPSSFSAASRSASGSNTIVERPNKPANTCPFTFAATPPNIWIVSTRVSLGSAAKNKG
jgi:hypothetical protein